MNEGSFSSSSSSSSSYAKAKHIVEVDKNIVAVFIMNPDGNISDLFIAEDAKIDSSMVESIRSALNLKFEKNKQEQRRTNPSSLGEHLWDISEYDKIRVIKIYESNRLIVVLAQSHTSAEVAETVLGYLYEEKDNEQRQPPSLF